MGESDALTGGQPIVLHVGKFIPPPFGGVESHVDTLLRALQPHLPVGLIAADSPLEPEVSRRLPYPVWACRNWGKFDAVTLSPGVLTQALRLMRRGLVRLLHLHLPNPWADALSLLAPRQLPIVATWHSDIVRQRRLMMLYRPIQRAALQRFDRVIVPTRAHLESSIQISGVRKAEAIRIVPFGIDVDALAPSYARPSTWSDLRRWSSGECLIATVGRHVYYKGYHHLLRAFSLMGSRARLVMVGHGPLTAGLQRYARQLGIDHRVRWLTAADRADVVAALHACDIFTLPSIERSEAFGLASAEAMACGRPTVVCRLANGVDVLNRHGLTSLVVPPNDPSALAHALDRLASDPTLRLTMGAAARQWVGQTFSIERMVAGTLATYQELWER